MARQNLAADATRTKILAGEAARLADSAMKSHAAAEKMRIESKPLDPLPLDETDRAMLAGLTELPDQLRKKLAGRARRFSVAEVTRIVIAVAESLLATEPDRQMSILSAAKRLLYHIHGDLL